MAQTGAWWLRQPEDRLLGVLKAVADHKGRLVELGEGVRGLHHRPHSTRACRDSKVAEPPNGLELSCPAEAGRTSFTLRHAGGPSKRHLPPSPPSQPKVLVPFQGFSALLGRRPPPVHATGVWLL